MTFQEIRAKHERLPYTGIECLSYRVEELLMSAEVNANDTCFAEKTATEAEWDRIAQSSLELLLGCCRDKQVAAWFRRIGFVW